MAIQVAPDPNGISNSQLGQAMVDAQGTQYYLRGGVLYTDDGAGGFRTVPAGQFQTVDPGTVGAAAQTRPQGGDFGGAYFGANGPNGAGWYDINKGANQIQFWNGQSWVPTGQQWSTTPNGGTGMPALDIALPLAMAAVGGGAGGFGPLAGAGGAVGGAGALPVPAATSGAAGGAAGGSGMFDLGGGLYIDDSGNIVGNTLFQGGPGTVGSGDFFSGGPSGLDFGGTDFSSLLTPSNAMQAVSAISRFLGPNAGTGFAPQGTPTAGSQGFDLSKLLPLLGVGSGLNTMFGSNPNTVDPNAIKAIMQAGQNTYNMAADPNQALHDRTQQQIVDASRAADSARGIAMSPVSAGVENKAVSDFNIDWQNAMLGRNIAGTQAFAGAGDTASKAALAGNAQNFAQNQTGLNNLTTGLGQIFGAGGLFGPTPNGAGSWLSSLFPGSGGAGGGGSVPGGDYTLPSNANNYAMYAPG